MKCTVCYQLYETRRAMRRVCDGASPLGWIGANGHWVKIAKQILLRFTCFFEYRLPKNVSFYTWETVLKHHNGGKGRCEYMPTVTVDKNKCDGEGTCVDVCPMNVYDLIEGKSQPTRAADCIACMACVNSCPTQAITVEP